MIIDLTVHAVAVSVLDVEDGDQAPAVHLEAACLLSAALTPWSKFELVCAAININ